MASGRKEAQEGSSFSRSSVVGPPQVQPGPAVPFSARKAEELREERILKCAPAILDARGI